MRPRYGVPMDGEQAPDDEYLVMWLDCQSCPEGLALVSFSKAAVERAEAAVDEQGLDRKQAAAAIAGKLVAELMTGERVCDDCKFARLN